MTDPFAPKTTTCDICQRRLSSSVERDRGRCQFCAESLEAGLSPEETRVRLMEHQREFQSAKIEGRPWWESARPVFISAYPDLDALNLEAPTAYEAGFRITAMTTTDGHTNVGRTAVGLWVAGPLGAALAHSRTEGMILVTWERHVRS